MPINLPRKFVDLVHQTSGEWTNWDPLIPIHLGDFGILGKNAEFVVDGNIYSDEFQQYLKGIKSSFNLNAYPVKFTEFDQNYMTLSSGVRRKQLDVDKFLNVPGVSSTSFKETWTFQDGKRGALLILISSYTISIPEIILREILEVERLEGKHLVTALRICPAYLKFLSNKSKETVSVAFCPNRPLAAGEDVANIKETGWWTDAQPELLRRETDPHGKPIFAPLFSLKHNEGSRWQDVYPTWGRLNEDGEMLVRSIPTGVGGGYSIRKFIDLVRKISGKWTNWDPPVPVTVGGYGTLDENGEFNVDGNIYSDEFQGYIEDQGSNFVARDYPPKLADPDQDYIIASSGVTKSRFDPDQQTNADIASASIKGTWKFRDGKRGALIILLRPRTSFVPNEIMTKILNVEQLRGKFLVTNTLTCPGYLMYLSDKSVESISVALCAKAQDGMINANVGGGWWVEDEGGIMRRGLDPNGEYRFTPLFSLKQTLKRSWFTWRGDEEQPTDEEYLWQDVYPNWKPLDKDGEEVDD